MNRFATEMRYRFAEIISLVSSNAQRDWQYILIMNEIGVSRTINKQ